MVEVDQFVIGLREPQFEKCGSYDSFGDRVYMKAYRHKLDTPPERRLLKIVWSFEIVWSGAKKNISRVRLLSPSWEWAGAGAGTHEGTRPITSNYAPTFRSGRHEHIIRVIFLSLYPGYPATEQSAE